MSVLAPVVLGLPLLGHLVAALVPVVPRPVHVSRPLTLMVSVSLPVKIQSLPLVTVSVSLPVQIKRLGLAMTMMLGFPVLHSLSCFPVYS